MADLVYSELSYILVGIAYKIDNAVGSGLQEKTYCDLFEKELIKNKLKYKRELYCPIIIDGKVVKKRYLDFLIDDKIVVEIKVDRNNYRSVFGQVLEYLKLNSLKLGLIIRFEKDEAKVRRIVNFID